MLSLQDVRRRTIRFKTPYPEPDTKHSTKDKTTSNDFIGTLVSPNYFGSNGATLFKYDDGLTYQNRLYIGGDKLTSIALNMLSIQVFVISEGIVIFVSVGSKQFMDSRIATRFPISLSSLHLSAKPIRYLAFCIIVIVVLWMSQT